MERPVRGASSRPSPSPWAEPPAFLMDLLVLRFVSSELIGRTVASLRLVSRRWRTAASAAVPALAARSNGHPLLSRSVARIFPHLQVLQLAGDGSLQGAIGLSSTLKCLRLLGSHNTLDGSPARFGPPAILAELTQLTGLVEFELEASWTRCCCAADCLTGLQQLRSLTLTPVAVSWDRNAYLLRQREALLERCSRLRGLRRLACAAHNAAPQHVGALTALRHLTALQLTALPNEAMPAVAQLGSQLRSLSLVSEADTRYCRDHQLEWAADNEGCTCAALPANAFSQLQHLEAAWDLLMAILLPHAGAAAIPAGTLPALTSLVLDMRTMRLVDMNEDEDWPAMVRRMRLLPGWLFGTCTCLRRLRLHGASSFGGWPGQMLERVSRLQPLEAVSFEYMDVDTAVVASLARLPRLRELEIGAEDTMCRLCVAPLRACTALTRLALVVDDSPMRVASEVAQLGHLRSLKLDTDGTIALNVMTRGVLERILTALPALKRLQSQWEPVSRSDEAFCQRFQGQLLHSKTWDRCGPHWLQRYDPANFSAAAALAHVAALLAD